MPKNVTAILVAYNSEKVIASAIAALLAETAISAIIVVDNCSQDKTRDLLKREFPKVILVANPQNAGYGPASNIALAKVETDFALLVNPDAVMNVGAIDSLLAAAARYPDAAILAPALYNERGQLHHSFKRNVFEREGMQDKKFPAEGELCADFISGAVMLFNMPLMRKIGFFDPQIFLYYEDDDICLRVRAAGHSIVYVPEARAVHLMGASTGANKPDSEFFKQKHMAWSRLYLEEKYHGREAARELAIKLQKKCAIKLTLYRLQFNRIRVARYKGRLAGITKFTTPGPSRQAA